MYKLYINAAGWSMLDMSPFEDDIVNTIIEDHSKYKHTYYMIIKNTNNTDDIFKITRTEEELLEYLQEYKERKRLNSIPIPELKKYIVKKRS